jgi:AcrR family transcriptional regulator
VADESASKQQQRAERILDAAVELVLRWGYKRVTIEEVAKRAGIGKGTIYLHWKTREALFMAVLARDSVKLYDELIDAMRKDPTEILAHRLMRRSFLLIGEHPLLQAVFTRDTEVLGDLVAERTAQPLRGQKLAFSQEYYELLRAHGLLRTDMAKEVQRYAISAAAFGFYMLDPLLPVEQRVPIHERAEIIAHTVRNAFEPPEPPEPGVLSALAPTVIEWFQRMRDGYSKFTRGLPAATRESPEE